MSQRKDDGSSLKHKFFHLMVSTTKVRLTCELTYTHRGDETFKRSIKFIYKILKVKMGQQFKEKDFGSNQIERELCYLSSFSFFLRRLLIISRSGSSLVALGLAALLWEGLGQRIMCECHWSKQGTLSCAKDHFKSILTSGEKKIHYQVAQCLLLWYFYWQYWNK